MINEKLVRDFFEAASELYLDGLKQLQTEESETFAEVAKAFTAGATISLSVEFDKTGPLQTVCMLNMGAEKVKIFNLEARQQTVN